MLCWHGCSCQISGQGASVVCTASWRCTSQTHGSLARAQLTPLLHIPCPCHVLVTVRAVPDVLAWLQLPDLRAGCPGCVNCLLVLHLTATWQPGRSTDDTRTPQAARLLRI